MGSNYFGGSSSSSSRKGKKSSNSSENKPKQPQRGLGVAQLEKIRLHGQLGSSYHPNLHASYQEDMRVQAAFSSPSVSYGFPSTVMPGVINPHDQYERTNIRYDLQPTTTSSWIPNTNMLEAQHYMQPNMTRHPMNVHAEDSMHKKSKKHRSHSMGSSSQNSDSSDTQEPDLELRLSL